MQVAATTILRIEVPAIFYVVERRTMQVGAAGDDERHRLRKRLQHLASRLTRRNVGGRIEFGDDAESRSGVFPESTASSSDARSPLAFFHASKLDFHSS